MWQDIEDDAWDLLGAGEPDLARQKALLAIRIEPNAIDSYVIIAQVSDILGEKIAFSREAVRLGEVRFADELAAAPSAEYTFWAQLETRPYMRGLHTLAVALWGDDRPGAQAEAIDIALHAIRICPNDNIGFRFLLLEWLARKERWSDGRALAELCADEYRTEIKMWGALYAFQDGDRDHAVALVREATQINPNVAKQLLLKKAPKISPAMMVAHGSREEAKAYAAQAYEVWHSVPEVVDWLKPLA